MTTLTTPIHVAGVGVANLRFFAPPDAARQYAWCSLDDLYGCLSVHKRMRQLFSADMHAGVVSDRICTVRTEAGTTDLVPHSTAHGIVLAVKQLGHIGEGTLDQYLKASAEALSLLTRDMPQAVFLDYVRDAAKAEGSPLEDQSR